MALTPDTGLTSFVKGVLHVLDHRAVVEKAVKNSPAAAAREAVRRATSRQQG